MTLLPEILQRRATLEPTRQAYVFLNEDGAETATLTFAELHSRALAVAGRLSQHCSPGARALLLFPQSLDFIVAYFGCLYAQVIAVPVNPPRRNRIQDATRSIVQDCEPSAVLTTSTMMPAARPTVESICGALHWLQVDQFEPDPDLEFQPRPCSADRIAFLQYTSGSTSDPKGVMVSHGNLVANQEMIRRGFGHDRDSTVVGWAPFFHDQGLIGNVLQPLYVGATSILMSPMAFIRRPMHWLSIISRYRAHTSGGPNFAFDACIAQAARGNVPAVDLSCWKVAFNGAEPIRPDTLRRFAKMFAPFGFREEALYPCYGLAEATLIVTGSRKGRGPRIIEAEVGQLSLHHNGETSTGRVRLLAGSGAVLPDEDVRIVNPETRRPCPTNEVGEIWIDGAHVAQGYWRRPETTAETFQAECDGETGCTYLRTGDLGLMVDGELYVVGRLKDVVIIRGRNYYPQDIEHTVGTSHAVLRPDACAAFSVPSSAGERLIVVQEVRRDCWSELDATEVSGSIRAAVLQEHELSVGDLVLTLPGRLPKTTSGKIRRSAARARYLADGFDGRVPAAPSVV